MSEDAAAAGVQQPVIRLSRAQWRVLRNLNEGLLAEFGLRGRSEFGGHVSVMQSLRVRGLVDADGEITDAGRALFHRPSDRRDDRATGRRRPH